MQSKTKKHPGLRVNLASEFLDRTVLIDIYLPRNHQPDTQYSLLLINDGQDLPKFDLGALLADMEGKGEIEPLIVVGIHCSEDRKMEYGTVAYTDYMGRGARAGKHQQFVFDELLPYLRAQYAPQGFKEKSYAGFSLGGLTAIDVVWNNPHEFRRAGVFSGSLWWRLNDIGKGYIEETDRIMHKQIREGKYHPWLKFYFTTGSLDETMDRNNNGIIDSIDDTLGLIEELEKIGYSVTEDIFYINYKDGRHDVETWGRAMPEFLRWGWGRREA
ncbi:MAG: esterase [Chitinophagaceae bacterium]|nr:esterase [Chitinophagaceae bacterium]